MLSLSNEKLVQHFNEALAMENAAVEYNQSRIAETPLELTRQQLQYHLEETFDQQARLRKIITGLGGSPTTMKAKLPKLVPLNMDTISNNVKEAAKSPVSDDSKDAMQAEKELINTQQDGIIESAEVVTYKMLIQMAQEIGLKDAIPELNKSLQEETSMVNFIMSNAPLALRILLPRIEPDKKKKKVAMAS